MNGLAPPLALPYNAESPGPWCSSHRSVYCEEVINFIADREDVDWLGAIVADRAPGEPLIISLPIYAQYCVWETISYVGKHDSNFGPMAVLERPNNWSQAITRILPGDSAADLAMVLRQNFEDEAEELLGNLQANLQRNPRAGIPWRCESQRHSVRYQNTMRQILDADTIAHAFASENMSVQYALMYALLRHKRCLFCWVNESKRDAVRVNPTMSAMFPDAQNNPPDFNDLVPN